MTKKTNKKPGHTPGPLFRWTPELAALWASGEQFTPFDAPLAMSDVRYRRLPDGSVMAEALSFGQPRIYQWSAEDFAAPRHHQDPENPPRCFPTCAACANQPDLAEAAKLVLEDIDEMLIDGSGPDMETKRRADLLRAAIAKAEGVL